MAQFCPLVQVKESGRLPSPNGKYSLFYALELAKNYQLVGTEITEKKFRYLMSSWKNQQELAFDLIERSNVEINFHKYGVEHLEIVQNFWDLEYLGMFRVVAFDMRMGIKPIFKGDGARKNEVCVIKEGNHWDGIKSVTKFFCVRNFCVSCETTYNRPEWHRMECKERCKKCCGMGYGFPCENVCAELYCKECNRNFYNKDCFEMHKKRACREYKKCKKCGETFKTRSEHKHTCGEKFCRLCKVYHPGRQCFIKRIKFRPQKAYRIVAYDLETTVEEREHRPNLVSATRTCSVCVGEEKDCEICEGPPMLTWSVEDGVNPISEFVDWIMGFKRFETVAFAHYGGRFDSHFVLRELTEKGFESELMMADLKIYQIKAGGVYFRDFWMLSQNRLAELPKTLELGIPAKMYFPHKYNKNENLGKKLEHLPPMEAYCPDDMKEEEFEKFQKWYNENYSTKFELGEQLRVYCVNDVEILMAAILKFRQLFLGITGNMDVLKDSVTIAGVVMRIFRTKFLKDKHIPIIPEGGYERAENQSKIAVKYFEWLAHRQGVKLRHACNGGEINFGGLKVDCVVGAKKRIIEFQGCAYHGCPRCFLPWTVGPNGLCAEENYRRTEIRMRALKEACKNFSVEEVWECDVKEEMRRNRAMKKFFDGVADKGPINPREAYTGGRTMPFCLFAKADDNVEISMFDIISLYPFVNYDTPYPVGIPKIIQSRNFFVSWTVPDDVPYDGLLKVKVIPPKNLLYPLLPLHIDDMLLFSNCGICAKKAKNEFVLAKDMRRCNHSPEQRSLVGTFTSVELRKALELGYRVIGFYRAYHFEQFDTQLFKGYVRMFLKIKVEASGWPPEVKTENQKRYFVEMYRAKYDICLDYGNISFNPGLRMIAKLGLNSLWGKFSMRNTLSVTEIISSMERWMELARDDTIEFKRPIKINDEITRVVYQKRAEFIKEHKVSNIVLSLWTTSTARIKLYEYMEMVYRAEGCKLLYCDTDSLIFTHPRGLCPLEEGKFLGEMTREYADSDILEYVSAGPKQYGLKMKRKKDGEIWRKIKIRGITLDRRNNFTYENFKKKILDFREGDKTVFRYPAKIGPTKDFRLLSRDVTKNYEPVQKKGIIDDDLNVLPFGYY